MHAAACAAFGAPGSLAISSVVRARRARSARSALAVDACDAAAVVVVVAAAGGAACVGGEADESVVTAVTAVTVVTVVAGAAGCLAARMAVARRAVSRAQNVQAAAHMRRADARAHWHAMQSRTGAAQDGAAAPERPVVRGRLIRAGTEDEYGNVITLEELRGIDLRGQPLMFEHKTWGGRIGRITENHVDDDGWLWIAGEIFSERDKPNSEFPAWIRKQLRENKLRDFSIGMSYEADSRTRRRVGPRVFHEASLVARGAYKGTHMVAVEASAHAANAPPRATTVVARIIASFETAHPRNMSTDSAATAGAAGANASSAAAPNPVAGSMTVDSVLEWASARGVEFKPQEIAGRDAFAVMQLAADRLAQGRELVAEAAAIKKREAERHEAEMKPRLEQFKKTAETLGVQVDDDSMGIASDIFMTPDAQGVAKIVSTISERLEQETKTRTEMEAKMKAIEAELAEARARDSIANVNQRKRANDGKFAAQELPARMATGGAGAATTTTAAAGAAAATTTTTVEASGDETAKRGRAVPSSVMDRILRAKHMFPLATFAPAMLEEGSSASALEVNASGLNHSGGIQASERKLIQKIIDLRSGRGMSM